MAVKIRDEFIDELVKGCKTADDIVGSQGVVKELTKRLLEKLLDTELTTHLGYAKNKTPEKKKGNVRNGHSAKTILTGEDELELKIPRDRKGEFEPLAIPKH
jgi:putative transposase